MPKLDLEDDHVFHEELTVEEIRAMDEALTEKVEGWLDKAQGDVFTGEKKRVYLVIEITK